MEAKQRRQTKKKVLQECPKPNGFADYPALAGKYTLLEKIGHGAQASVFKARDANGQVVAIKIFDLREVADWKAVELWKREVDVLKSLHIKGIPKYMDYIEDMPHAYLVESFIEAKSLDTWMNDGVRFTQAQIGSILRKTLHILDLLHQQIPPIIHRDIKPGNILVDIDGDKVKVWVVDMGAVTSLRHKSHASTVAGTVGYAPPEQFLGQATPASDIYALGMTIVHLITGVKPWNMDVHGLEIQYEKYLPSWVPTGFRKLLFDMLRPDPNARIQSASAVIERLKVLKKKAKNEARFASQRASSLPSLPLLPLVPVACGTTAKEDCPPALPYSPEFFSVLKDYSREDQIYIIQSLHTLSNKPDTAIVNALGIAMRQIGNKSNIELLIARTLNILKYPAQIDNYREGSAHEMKIKTEDGPDGVVILAMIVSIGAVLGGIAMVICDPNFTLVMAMTYILGGSFWIGVAGYMAKGCAVTVAILIIIMLCSEFTLAGWGILLTIGGIASLIALATRDKD